MRAEVYLGFGSILVPSGAVGPCFHASLPEGTAFQQRRSPGGEAEQNGPRTGRPATAGHRPLHTVSADIQSQSHTSLRFKMPKIEHRVKKARESLGLRGNVKGR